MNKKIVIINGTGGCGKDTFVSFVADYVKVYNFSSIDIIREIASLKTLTGISQELIKKIGYNGDKSEKSRKFLSDLKILFKNYNDLPFYKTKEAIEYFKKTDDEVMFIHIREPEEIERVKNIDPNNIITLLIKRNGLDNITSNDSDKNVNEYSYDYSIVNNSLEELERDAISFLEELKENGLKK